MFHRGRLLILLLPLLVAGLWPKQTRAMPSQHFRLKYAVAPGLRCPAEKQLRSEVASRMAHDPWKRDARRVIHVQISSSVGGMEAKIWIREAAGQEVGKRSFRSTQGNCAELLEHVAFHLALVIDPLGVRRPRAPRPPAGKASSVTAKPARATQTPPATSPTVATRPTPAARLDHLTLSVGGVFSMGAAAGDLSGGVTAQIRYRWWKLSVALEGRVELPAYLDVPGGQISTTLVSGAVLPCFHRRWLALCGVFRAGALRGQGHGLSDAKIETLPYLAGGIRAAAELRLSHTFSVSAYGDLVVPVPITLTNDATGEAFWTTPVINGALGVALAAGFL